MDQTARIKSHMTRDHNLALLDYLVVYGKVNANAIEPGTINMTDVNTESFTICFYTSSPQKVTIRWKDAWESENLPVDDISDVKPKLVSMAKYAAAKQGYAHTQINKTVPPTPASYPMYVYFVVAGWAAFAPASFQKFVANNYVLSRIAALLPLTFRSYLSKNIRKIFIGTYIVHLFEIFTYSIPTFIKYRVPAAQRLQWTLMHFVEGFLVPLRLKKLKEGH
ncbi:hypothetical protein PGUG_05065 [Meyerozyma guilliermondii ATCC 6260]|uniref:DUF2470 domain-containing protein n=1 Tax=Meyerozyma guilliermondii (strain ATCC 6260 / CBS 566 / DSM 6381 / JCM 1539 / NBRC 10279 / NRRL Y-324) TaxID=294746 RepID=A5DP64_PICGU|nr:uncharacterized protein PGUG_05065 [Meyerozyma guilliermondii ATCC 6260]EDK40967.1 hypothetical protein PGUG_05065 [Meyerozyma guilliermondii ATCC 6260]